MTNTLKTTALLAALTALLVLIGDYFGGQGGMLLFFGLAVVINLSAYWWSGDIALRMAGAREVSPEEAPELHHGTPPGPGNCPRLSLQQRDGHVALLVTVLSHP